MESNFKIVEQDSYIEYKDKSYHLYLLKNKKELKEDDTDKYKIGGYFNKLDSAIKEIIKFRKGKKYPFKQDYKKIKYLFNSYLNEKQKLSNILNITKFFVNKFKLELFKYDEHKLKYWK